MAEKRNSNSNSNSDLLAALLADSHKGFTGLQYTKVGSVVRGVRYGNERKHYTVLTGFSYESLVQRSLDAMPSVQTEAVLADAAHWGRTDIKKAHVEAARVELAESFRKTLDGTSTASTDHVYDPLIVKERDDEGNLIKMTVPGSRVYKCVKDIPNPETGGFYRCHCRECTGEQKAPLAGTIYLQGLIIWSTVLEPAPNGPVPGNPGPKTVAKKALRALLPVGRYRSFRLEPGTDFILHAGRRAVESMARGFLVDAEVLMLVKKVA
jgi:hypothetical protein